MADVLQEVVMLRQKETERKYFVIYFNIRNSASLQRQEFLTKEYSFEQAQNYSISIFDIIILHNIF